MRIHDRQQYKAPILYQCQSCINVHLSILNMYGLHRDTILTDAATTKMASLHVRVYLTRFYVLSYVHAG
jgi:hypothetical protein